MPDANIFTPFETSAMNDTRRKEGEFVMQRESHGYIVNGHALCEIIDVSLATSPVVFIGLESQCKYWLGQDDEQGDQP